MRFIPPLNLREQNALNEVMKSSTNFKERQRAHAILLSTKKYRIEDLSDIFEVDRDTVSEWLTRWEEHGINGLKDAPRSGRPRKTRSRKRKTVA